MSAQEKLGDKSFLVFGGVRFWNGLPVGALGKLGWGKKPYQVLRWSLISLRARGFGVGGSQQSRPDDSRDALPVSYRLLLTPLGSAGCTPCQSGLT